MTVLVLGGTAEARALAAGLVAAGVDVVSSLAGRVADPALPVGRVRVGGFGGVAGLARYLVQERITTVIDATHPFAAQISAHAVEATAAPDVRLRRRERPGGTRAPGAPGWSWVPATAAAVVAGAACTRPFLTTGRQSLEEFLGWADRDALVRVVDRPTFTLPPRWQLLCSRGPYEVAAERALLSQHQADLLVTKDSGGTHTSAKLHAAGELGVRVVVISRPPRAGATLTVADVATAVAFCRRSSS